MLAYVVVACLINYIRHGTIQHPNKEIISVLFDGSLFAGSIVLLIGVVYEPVLKEIGDTKPFLLIAGAAGAVYPLVALFPISRPKKKKQKKNNSAET